MKYSFDIMRIVLNVQSVSKTPVHVFFNEFYNIKETIMFSFTLKGPFIAPIEEKSIDFTIAPSIISTSKKIEERLVNLIKNKENTPVLQDLVLIILNILNGSLQANEYDYTEGLDELEIEIGEGKFKI